jgi:hypothetical protein
MLSFLHRYLEPAETLGELFFGFVMAMSFTIGGGVLAERDPAIAEEVILGAVACNLAWGVIDGAIFVMGRMFERGRIGRVHQSLKSVDRREAGIALLAEYLRIHLRLESAKRLPEIDALAARLFDLLKQSDLARNRPTREDLGGGALVFLLVALTGIWAALPLLFLPDHALAIRVSNAASVAALFFIGYKWGHFTNASPWATGAVAASVGVLLGIVAILLGG